MDNEVVRRVSSLSLAEYNVLLFAAVLTLNGADGCTYEEGLASILMKAGADINQEYDIDCLGDMIKDI